MVDYRELAKRLGTEWADEVHAMPGGVFVSSKMREAADVEGLYIAGARDAQHHALRPEAIHHAIEVYDKTGSIKSAIEAALGTPSDGNGC